MKRPEVSLEALRCLLAMQIKLDIARAIREHPHLQGDDSVAAYHALANDDAVNRLIAEMAREEISEVALRGDPLAPRLMQLASFRANRPLDN